MTIHGKGSQYWMTKKYEYWRNKALLDNSNYSTAQLDSWDIVFPEGGGVHNYKSFLVWQTPFPIDQSIRTRKHIDFRINPAIGF